MITKDLETQKTISEVIQSYILTVARYDYSVHEKRILYRIIELMQKYTQGIKLNQKYTINKTMFDDVDIVMPVSAFLNREGDKNHTFAKEALLSLNRKQIRFENDKIWCAFNLIERPYIDKGNGLVSFRISPIVATAFLNFSKGYSKYELETVMKFESIYAMRFYELLSTQKGKITYGIDTLKTMFQIEDKYVGKNNDFIRKVVLSAQKELDAKSPVSFLFAPSEKKQGKKILSIDFYPVAIPENRDPVLEQFNLQKNISLRWDLDIIFVNYLKEHFNFTNAQIKNNIELFKACSVKLPDFILILSKLRVYCSKRASPQGTLINSLKKMLDPNSVLAEKRGTKTSVKTKTDTVKPDKLNLEDYIDKVVSLRK